MKSKPLFFAVFAVLTALLAGALYACAQAASFTVDDDGQRIHAVATGKAMGISSGDIDISVGEGICVNHIVEAGKFNVLVTIPGGSLVKDIVLKNNVAHWLDVEPGTYNISIEAVNATGTVDIIPYDKHAEAIADATMPSDVREFLEK